MPNYKYIVYKVYLLLYALSLFLVSPQTKFFFLVLSLGNVLAFFRSALMLDS
jgi:hypothetical protein